jgi:hypothetical protein
MKSGDYPLIWTVNYEGAQKAQSVQSQTVLQVTVTGIERPSFLYGKAERKRRREQVERDDYKEIDSSDFWRKVDGQFNEITQAGKSAFIINRNINVILVIIGVTVIGSALVRTWTNGADLSSALLGGCWYQYICHSLFQ